MAMSAAMLKSMLHRHQPFDYFCWIKSSAFARLFTNPWLWAAVSLSLLLQVAVVHVPFLNIAFGTAPLALDQWLVCAAMASGVVIYSELRKLLGRRRGR